MTNDVQTAVRLPSEVLQAVDELAKKLSSPGIRIARASVLRMLIVEGVKLRTKGR